MGLYLSKYDSVGLNRLGFDSFVEAFNVIGYAVGSRPASIKNYRDEFDAIYPNGRKGWRNRPMRQYCRVVFERYNSLDFDSFTGLVRSLFVPANDEVEAPGEAVGDDPCLPSSSFSSRLITGLAAERYFEQIQPQLPEFRDYRLENATQWGCGYDFRLTSGPMNEEFVAVEVKGLKRQSGSISMTPKEHSVASLLRERFFLFVVRNFSDIPSHSLYCDPLRDCLSFRKIERTVVQTTWMASV